MIQKDYFFLEVVFLAAGFFAGFAAFFFTATGYSPRFHSG
jgi:hypothetical protein